MIQKQYADIYYAFINSADSKGEYGCALPTIITFRVPETGHGHPSPEVQMRGVEEGMGRPEPWCHAKPKLQSASDGKIWKDMERYATNSWHFYRHFRSLKKLKVSWKIQDNDGKPASKSQKIH